MRKSKAKKRITTQALVRAVATKLQVTPPDIHSAAFGPQLLEVRSLLPLRHCDRSVAIQDIAQRSLFFSSVSGLTIVRRLIKCRPDTVEGTTALRHRSEIQAGAALDGIPR